MNNYYQTTRVHASSPEQRERIFEEIHDKPIGDEYYCKNFFCKREGDHDIIFHVNMLGGINDGISEILDLLRKYPDATEEEWGHTECWPSYHRLYHNDYWEDIWSVEDAVDAWDTSGEGFSPKMLEIETFRKVYDYEGNLLSEERKRVPYPVELMDDYTRDEYEKWKKDPVKWEEDRKKTEEGQVAISELWRPENIDDLPF